MINHFKITSIAFILFLFGFSIITDPILAQRNKVSKIVRPFLECNAMAPPKSYKNEEDHAKLQCFSKLAENIEYIRTRGRQKGEKGGTTAKYTAPNLEPGSNIATTFTRTTTDEEACASIIPNTMQNLQQKIWCLRDLAFLAACANVYPAPGQGKEVRSCEKAFFDDPSGQGTEVALGKDRPQS